MGTTTLAMDLRKPAQGDKVEVDDDLNANSDRIDMVAGRGVPVVRLLTDASPVLTNAATGKRFRASLAADRVLAAPSNPVDGQEVVWEVTASGGTRTLSLATGAGGFEFGTDLTGLSAIAAGTTDYIGCVFNAGRNRWRVVSYAKGFPAAL